MWKKTKRKMFTYIIIYKYYIMIIICALTSSRMRGGIAFNRFSG